MEDSSDFFTSQDGAQKSASLQLVHSSQNGFVEIWRVDRMGRFRALKCLKAEYRGNRLYEDLLRKEFEIGYSLRHPGIVEYYGFVKEEGLGNCIEMEWIDGRTLAVLKEQGPLGKDLEDSILDELCDALSYLHSRGVVHRDLKPSNIMVTHTGYHVRLIDFGFSDTASHSILKASAGTVTYAAPEVLAGGVADELSDIYSLGLVMTSLSRRHGGVIRKCCERHPRHRYQSVAAVKKALHSHSMLWAGILFIGLVVLMVLLPLLPRQVEETSPVVSQADTAAVLPVQEPVAAPAAAKPMELPVRTQQPRPEAATSAKEVAVDTALIDDLFRQATDLFD
jgi:serine/threonine protein kinase